MSHLVLARKYRPKYFSNVIGQDNIVATLTSALRKNRVAHALLFTGSRGTGKTTLARLLAKSLVCLDINDIEPCGKCVQCQSIDNFSSLDVIEIDGASNTGVDDIRELREHTKFHPISAKYKIFIIDEVHMLSINAFNALLKILEEPPSHVIFIFATTEVHKIPKTILSRCQRYDFQRVSIKHIVNTLRDICKNENIIMTDDALHLIAVMSDGGMRDALSMTEQIINHDHEKYSAEIVSSILGIVSTKAVKDYCFYIIDGHVQESLSIIKDIYEKGLDLCQMIDAIAEYFRTLSIYAHVEEDKAQEIIPSFDQQEYLKAKSIDKMDLKRLFAMSIEGISEVFQSKRPLLSIELFTMRAALRPHISEAFTVKYCLNKLDAILSNRQLKPIVSSSTPQQTTTSASALNNLIADKQIIKQNVLIEKAMSDPLVKKALEIFGGDIADVKLNK